MGAYSVRSLHVLARCNHFVVRLTYYVSPNSFHRNDGDAKTVSKVHVLQNTIGNPNHRAAAVPSCVKVVQLALLL